MIFAVFSFDTFLNIDLTQVWGPASFGLPPPRTITFCTSPPSTTPPQTTPQASSNSTTPHSSRSTRNNPHNSRVSCMSSDQQCGQSNDQDGQSKGELSNINPMNSYSVSISSGSCSKENSAERRSWQMAFLQSVSQRGQKPQWDWVSEHLLTLWLLCPFNWILTEASRNNWTLNPSQWW